MEEADFKIKRLDYKIEKLWEELEDVTMEETEEGFLILSSDWEMFKKGTSSLEIRKWFDTHHSKGVGYLINGYGVNKNVKNNN